jgi:exonuclease SbcC
MDLEQVATKLGRRYPALERLSDVVFRGVDTYDGRPYAVRYFDVSDNVVGAAEHLREYQDRLLGVSYFNTESKADLRWNHYLYFVTSKSQSGDAFLKAKAAVESDREYARKLVIAEDDLDTIFEEKRFGIESAEGLPPDPLSIWTGILEKHALGFIVDESLQVPAIVRHIADGEPQPLVRAPAIPNLDPAEKAVSAEFLASIAIREFRKYPLQKTFDFGAVNLIVGVNGVGKTSLFEAIEYLFCGKTRRAESVLLRTVVSGVLANSELTLETRTTTSPSKLRSRHLVWYGKSEVRTLTLDDSFSKFNFLDTDAAVRLTVEKSRERIIDDLAQLLLGAEASKALDRFERVTRQLQESRKTLENDVALRELRRAESASRVQQLRQMPRESDQFFKELLLGLKNVGWLQPPPGKGQTDQLSASLQSALVNVGPLKARQTLGTGAEGIDDVLRALAESRDALRAISTEESARKGEDARTRQRLQELDRRLEALEGLAPIIGAGVGELHRKRERLERQLAERTAALTEAEAAANSLASDKALGRMMLSRAVSEWTEQVSVANGRAKDAKQALIAFERTQGLLTSLRQRLSSAAQELIQHTGDPTHCPLCKAEYSAVELNRRLEDTARGLVTGESDRLHSEIQKSEALHTQRVSELRALRTLERYSQGESAKTSVQAAIRAVATDREHAAVLQSELEVARSSLQAQEKKGWTFSRLLELSSAAGIAESSTSPKGLDDARGGIRKEQKDLLGRLSELEAQRETSESRIAQIGIPYGLATTSSTELEQVISERAREAQETRKATLELSSLLKLDPQRSSTELESGLRQAQDLAVRLRTAIAKEDEDSAALTRESRVMEDAAAEVAGLRVKLKRVESAAVVIEDLVGQQSERDLAEQVLRENAASISSTFAKIHAPSEFDLVIEDGLKIVRRGGRGNVELDEMSSGQRAAYALSLFLAMNERLRTGPKLLMFDDPVAHVDDINTLSFLDHLRDIALGGERQIFFATADSKLAGLFGRKFRFLGERFKQVNLTRQ